jgi:LacI family transcriptional regulator
MKQRITLKHIANTFNVSIATVSKALNDSEEISKATKAKIKEYAKANNYKPNNIALSLLNKKTKTIGVIIPNIMNSFFTKVFVGIEKAATEHGYNLISCITNESYEKEVKTMELLKNGTLDGFIISISEETEINQNFNHLKNSINQGVPIVLFDRVTNKVDCDKVIVDDELATYKATKHLANTGCKKIAFISSIPNLSVGKLRLRGYKKAIKELNYPLSNDLIVTIYNKQEFKNMVEHLLNDKEIDALMCVDESSALKALRLVKKLGYKVPDQMSIICFSNGKLPRYVTPTLTTISQHGRVVGEKVTKMLIHRLENQEAPYSTSVIETSLIERETTKQLIKATNNL